MKYACLFLTLAAILPVSAPASFAEEYTAEEFLAFRDEARAAHIITDRDERITYLRDAIAAHGDHPLNLILERDLMHSVGSPQAGEALPVALTRKLPALLDVIARYRDVDYYDHLDPRLAYDLEFLIPEMARQAAEIELHQNHNRAKARAHLTMALDYISLTLESRRAVWPALTPPQPPPLGASEVEKTIFQLADGGALSIAGAVEDGSFATYGDHISMQNLLLVYANSSASDAGKSAEVELSNVAKRYAGTAIETAANYIIAYSVKRATDVFQPLVKSGRLIPDEPVLTAPIDNPDEITESRTAQALTDSPRDSANAPAFESDTTDIDAGSEGRRDAHEGQQGYADNGPADDARGGPRSRTVAAIAILVAAGLLLLKRARHRRRRKT